MTSSTIVLIHGLWMTPLSWEHWVDRYERAGHRVLAPAWPGMDGEIADLRRDPSPFARLGVTEVVDHYDAIIRELDEPPIVMGQDGWEQVSDHALAWALEHASRPAPASAEVL